MFKAIFCMTTIVLELTSAQVPGVPRGLYNAPYNSALPLPVNAAYNAALPLPVKAAYNRALALPVNPAYNTALPLPINAAYNPALPLPVNTAYNRALGIPGTAPYNTPFVPTIDYSNEINIDGSYRYSFATADGKQAEESGYLKDVAINAAGEPIGTQVVQGSYSYTSPEGTPVQVSYIADENGFQPTSIRIPSVPGALPLGVNPLAARAGLAGAYRNPYAAAVAPYAAAAPYAGRLASSLPLPL